MEPSRQEIWKMFDGISRTYDRVNRVMTFGLDLYWRKKVKDYLPQNEEIHLLDLATGTADQIVSLMDHSPQITQAVGIDLSQEMLRIGAEKLKKKSYASKVFLKEASALALPFGEGCFDCVTISFGIRNVTDVGQCLLEMRRVLRGGGRALILEGSRPANRLLYLLHSSYLRYLMPRIGGLLSRQRDAYRYLNKTIESFPSGEALCALMRRAGFAQAVAHPLSGGAVTIYEGIP